MSWLITLLRRTILLIAIGALGSALVAWLRERNRPTAADSPSWPPLDDAATATTDPAPAVASDADSSDINPLVASADGRPSGNGDATWVAPNDDGTCPVTHPIKANDNSGIFHVPGGQFYDRTGPERCYASAEAALADGYRQAKA